jgi:hypothetical protein
MSRHCTCDGLPGRRRNGDIGNSLRQPGHRLTTRIVLMRPLCREIHNAAWKLQPIPTTPKRVMRSGNDTDHKMLALRKDATMT